MTAGGTVSLLQGSNSARSYFKGTQDQAQGLRPMLALPRAGGGGTVHPCLKQHSQNPAGPVLSTTAPPGACLYPHITAVPGACLHPHTTTVPGACLHPT